MIGFMIPIEDRTLPDWNAKRSPQPRHKGQDPPSLPGVAALSELLSEHCPVAAAGIPALNQVGDKGFQHAWLAFGELRRTEECAYRAAVQAQLSANRSKWPALGVQLAYPLKAFQPSGTPLCRLLSPPWLLSAMSRPLALAASSDGCATPCAPSPASSVKDKEIVRLPALRLRQLL